MKSVIPFEYCFLLISSLLALAIPTLFEGFYGRSVLFGVLVSVFGAFGMVQPRSAIISVIFFLAVLGEFRRYLTSIFGFGGLDPLLLVVPVATSLMVIVLLINKRLHVDTQLSKAIALLSGIMVLEIFNPLQGGIAVGVAGAMFYLIPLSWYWIGKEYGTPELIQFMAFKLILPLAVLAVLLAFYQLLFGLFPYEYAWLKYVGANLAVWASDTTSKPLSFFTSPIEYVRFLSICMGFILAAWFRGKRLLIVWLPLFAVAAFVEGSRTPVVESLFALAVLWAAQGRTRATWLPRLILALVIGAVSLYLGLTSLQDKSFSQTAANDLIQHQTQGLLNPLDSRYSTAEGHFGMIVRGVKIGFINPIGTGLGSRTLAASRFGNGGGSTEVDFSDLFASLGALGGLLYLWIMYKVVTQSVALWQQSRELYALLIFAALISVPGAWLLSGGYIINTIIWLLVGAQDGMMRKRMGVERALSLGHA